MHFDGQVSCLLQLVRRDGVGIVCCSAMTNPAVATPGVTPPVIAHVFSDDD